MTSRRRRVALVPVMLALLAACAGGGDDTDGGLAGSPADGAGGDGPRVVEIAMRDIAFVPDRVEVTAGETVRFVFTNDGAVPHDGVIGDMATQDEHELAMRAAEQDATSTTGPAPMPGDGHEHPDGTGEADHTHPEATAVDGHEHPVDSDHEHPDSTAGDDEPPADPGASDRDDSAPAGHAHGTSGRGPGAAITVAPGGRGDLTYTFAAGESVEIGCHQRGHYDAGMYLAIDVVRA